MANDARNKLRNMGGIMASFPELVQETQYFNNGGTAQAPVDPIAEVVPQDPYGQSQGKLAAMILRTMQQLAEETDPNVRQGLENRLKVLQTAQTVKNAAVDTVTDAASLTMRAVNNPLLSAAGNVAGVVNPEFGATILDLRDRAAKTADELALMGEEEDPVAALLESSTAGQASDEPEEAAPAEDQDPTVEQGPASEGLVVKPELLDRVLEAVNQDPTLTPQGDPAPVPTKRDLRSQYRKNIELFKEIYGESDEDRARDKAMSLAMLGLAIASGQSPNALTNIAQGTMAGLQGMSEQEQARRERDRGLQTLALETAIGEQSAAAEAERQAAEGELEFKRDLALERVKLGGADDAGGLKLEPVKAVADYEAQKMSELRKGISDGSEIVPENYRENPEAWVDLKRRKGGRNYAFGLMQQAGPNEMPGLMRSGQLYLYRNENNLPIVTSPTELAFIFPGQDYVEYDRTTDTSTVTTKPMPE